MVRTGGGAAEALGLPTSETVTMTGDLEVCSHRRAVPSPRPSRRSVVRSPHPNTSQRRVLDLRPPTSDLLRVSFSGDGALQLGLDVAHRPLRWPASDAT